MLDVILIAAESRMHKCWVGSTVYYGVCGDLLAVITKNIENVANK